MTQIQFIPESLITQIFTKLTLVQKLHPIYTLFVNNFFQISRKEKKMRVEFHLES